MAIPNDLRQMNRRRLLWAALRMGAASRSDLARATGMSQPTAGKIVDELIDERVLTAASDDGGKGVGGEGVNGGRLGRPGTSLRLDSSSRRFLAIQLGVTHTRLAALAVAPPPADEWAEQFVTPPGARQWIDAVATASKKALPKPDAIVVSVPGIVDEATGRILKSPNVTWADDVDVRSLLRGVAGKGTPTFVVQEIRGLALGVLATAPQARDFLLVDFGNGVGAVTVVGGKVHQGKLPMIAEIGHTHVSGTDRPCGCGATGCLETLVSRTAIARAVLGTRSGRARRGEWERVREAVQIRGITGEFGAALDAAGHAIAGALNAVGVDRVIVTGSLSELPDLVLQRLTDAVRRHAFWARVGTIEVVAQPRRRLAGMAYTMLDRVLAPHPTNSDPSSSA